MEFQTIVEIVGAQLDYILPLIVTYVGWIDTGNLSEIISTVILCLTAWYGFKQYLKSSRDNETALYAGRLSNAYNLFTREWKEKVLNPPVVYHRAANSPTGAVEVLDSALGKKLYDAQQAERRRLLRTAPHMLPDGAASPPNTVGGIERIELKTRLMVRHEIRKHYNFNKLSAWTDENDLGPIQFGDRAEATSFEDLHRNLEEFWRNAHKTGFWEKDAAYELSIGLQELGAYVRVGAAPLNHVCMSGSRLIIEEWVYCMSQVYADYRRGDENLSLISYPNDRFIGAARRHAEWLACAAAIYWVRKFKTGYVNYFILEMEAELTRQDAVRQALTKRPNDISAAIAAGRAARDRRYESAGAGNRRYLQSVGGIEHIRERERTLRFADTWLLDPDVRKVVDKEIEQILDDLPYEPKPRRRAKRARV